MSEFTKALLGGFFYLAALAAQVSGYTNPCVAAGILFIGTGFLIAAGSDHWGWNIGRFFLLGRLPLREAAIRVYEISRLADHLPMAEDGAAAKENYHLYQLVTLAKEKKVELWGRKVPSRMLEQVKHNELSGLKPSADSTSLCDLKDNVVYSEVMLSRRDVRSAAKYAKKIAEDVKDR